MLKLYKHGEQCWGLLFEMPEIIGLRDNLQLCSTRKIHRMRNFLQTFPVFVTHMAEGRKWLVEELKAEPYFEYLLHIHRRTESEDSLRTVRYILGRMRKIVRLYEDIRDYGIKAPMDMYRESGRFILGRGNRCLEIMRQLGYENVICRLFETRQVYLDNLSPPAEWGPLKGS